MWFIQLESRFVTADITDDETMFHYDVGALDGDILTNVSDIFKSPQLKKLKSRPVEAATGCASTTIRLFVTDLTSKLKYLDDSGANISIVPSSSKDKQQKPNTLKLSAVNGTANIWHEDNNFKPWFTSAVLLAICYSRRNKTNNRCRLIEAFRVTR